MYHTHFVETRRKLNLIVWCYLFEYIIIFILLYARSNIETTHTSIDMKNIV